MEDWDADSSPCNFATTHISARKKKFYHLVTSRRLIWQLAFWNFISLELRGPTDTVSESTVWNTELREFVCPHQVLRRELSAFLSAYYLCAKANSRSFSRRAHRVCPKSQWGSVSSLLRNSTLEFRPFPIECALASVLSECVLGTLKKCSAECFGECPENWESAPQSASESALLWGKALSIALPRALLISGAVSMGVALSGVSREALLLMAGGIASLHLSSKKIA